MGCWNGTCCISNLHVNAGQPVAVFMLLENKEKKSFCYSNALYDVCPIPFYGKYDDYGSVKNVTGFGLNIVVEALRDQLYEFGAGPNSNHNIAVNKGNFDTEMLFNADTEDRLGIECFSTWNSDNYQYSSLDRMRTDSGLTSSQQFELDRLAAKIKKEDAFRRVTHVIIHGDVFKNIMEKWYIREFVGSGNGTLGYDNSYNNVYFSDIVASIPEYLDIKKKELANKSRSRSDVEEAIHYLTADRDLRTTSNHAAIWIRSFNHSSSDAFGLIKVQEYISEYVNTADWAGLESFVKEALTGAWINSFMNYSRKVWSKQSGTGSQSQESDCHILLAETIKSILDTEKEMADEF